MKDMIILKGLSWKKCILRKEMREKDIKSENKALKKL